MRKTAKTTATFNLALHAVALQESRLLVLRQARRSPSMRKAQEREEKEIHRAYSDAATLCRDLNSQAQVMQVVISHL
jgi:hypothetical protein